MNAEPGGIPSAGADLITGRPLPDTEDEPVRQLTEQLLLNLGFAKSQIEVDASREVEADGDRLRVTADLLVSLQGRPAMVLHCRRGSLISRERETVAIARLLAEHQVPAAVVTNSQDAQLLDTASGRVAGKGIAAIPGPEKLAQWLAEHPPLETPPRQFRQAARIYRAYATLHCSWACPA